MTGLTPHGEVSFWHWRGGENSLCGSPNGRQLTCTMVFCGYTSCINAKQQTIVQRVHTISMNGE